MLKKVSKLLIALVLIWIGFFYGFLAHKYELFPAGAADWLSNRLAQTWQRTERRSEPQEAGTSHETTEQRRRQQLASLSQLGYLAGSEPPPPEVGVLVHDEQRAYPGYNFYVSADGPHARLMDMDGEELHRWSHRFREDWPAMSPEDEIIDFERHPDHWQRAYLFPNGDVLAILEGSGLVKVDKDSNLIWARRGPFHHDLEVTGDGRIFVLTRREVAHHPDLDNLVPIIEDLVSVLSAEGELIRQISLVDALYHSRFRHVAFGKIAMTGDLLHANTVEVLAGKLASRSSAFREGNLLVSFRNIDLIAVVDVETEKVVWALTGMWKMQHQPTVLDNGNLLLFNNYGQTGAASSILEFNPFTQEAVWSFEGDESNEFFSYFAGSNERLPNGNTLITSSTQGTVLEVTPDKQLVWQWANPRKVEAEKPLIAVVNEMLRIEPEYVSEWLDPE